MPNAQYERTGRRWYQDNKERLLSASKKRYQRLTPSEKLYRGVKLRASERGWDFDIDPEDIEIPERCPVLGEPLVPHTRYAPSVDRIDNNKGYVKGNVQVISLKANNMKNDASPEELRKFYEWLKKTFQH